MLKTQYLAPNLPHTIKKTSKDLVSVSYSLEWSYHQQIHLMQIDKWLKKYTSM